MVQVSAKLPSSAVVDYQLLQQTAFLADRDNMGPVARVQLAANRAHVHFHRDFRIIEQISDFLVRQAFGQHPDNAELSVTQTDGFGGLFIPGFAKSINRHENLPRQNEIDGTD